MKKFSESILFVEDNLMLRSSYTRLLESLFYQVYVAENGEEGLRLFHEKSPSLILTDIEMPLINGLEMSQKIIDKSPSIPILIYSGNTENVMEHDLFKRRNVFLFSKPLFFKDLYLVLEEIYFPKV